MSTQQEELTASLHRLMKKARYTDAVELLNTHRLAYTHDKDPLNRIASMTQVFDAIEATRTAMSEASEAILLSLAVTGLKLNDTPLTMSRSKFQETLEALKSDRNYTKSNKPLFDALGRHPLTSRLRERVFEADIKSSAKILKDLWERHDRAGFLYAYDTLKWATRTRDRNGHGAALDITLDEAMATDPDLELVVIDIARGNYSLGFDVVAALPPLRMIISNAPTPVDYDLPAVDENNSAWQRAKDDFWLVSATGTYTHLTQYIRAAVNSRGESRSHGPYLFMSNSDKGIATAANTVATAHAFLARKTNFAIDAQVRLRAQLEQMQASTLSSINSYRYLKLPEPIWSKALNLIYDQPTQHNISPYDAAKALTGLGMCAAVNRLISINLRKNTDIEDAKAGFRDGLQLLLKDMQELLHSDGAMSAALQRYEQTFGVHSDVKLFSIEERSQLAFQDLSNIAIAHIAGDTVIHAIIDEKEEAADFLSSLPLSELLSTMIEARDVRNFMRAADNSMLALAPFFPAFIERLNADGYEVEPVKRSERFENLEFELLRNPEGTFYLRAGKMPHYQTADQIINNDDLVNAVVMLEALDKTDFAKDANHSDQAQLLRNFSLRNMLIETLKKQVKDIPKSELTFEVEDMKRDADRYTKHLRERGATEPERLVAEALAIVGGKRQTGIYDRIVKAVNRVSGLTLKS